MGQFPRHFRSSSAISIGGSRPGFASIAKLYRGRETSRPYQNRGSGRDSSNLPAAADVPLGQTDLVIEAAVERMDLKKQLFQRHRAFLAPFTRYRTGTFFPFNSPIPLDST